MPSGRAGNGYHARFSRFHTRSGRASEIPFSWYRSRRYRGPYHCLRGVGFEALRRRYSSDWGSNVRFVSRILGALAVALTDLIPEGINPTDSGHALAIGILLVIYAVVHEGVERYGPGGE